MVAHLHGELERVKPVAREFVVSPSRPQDSDKCFWNLGMWSLLPKGVVPMAVAPKHPAHINHGKKIDTNHSVWGLRLSKCRVLFQCDNLSLVSAIANGYSRDKGVMRLLRCMWFFVACFDLDLYVEHIAGVDNTTADQLSRNQLQSFFSHHPQVSVLPTPIPPALLEIVSSADLEWTSSLFKKLFRSTITWAQHQSPGHPTARGSGTTSHSAP